MIQAGLGKAAEKSAALLFFHMANPAALFIAVPDDAYQVAGAASTACLWRAPGPLEKAGRVSAPVFEFSEVQLQDMEVYKKAFQKRCEQTGVISMNRESTRNMDTNHIPVPAIMRIAGDLRIKTFLQAACRSA